jgi:hypothetical protein
MIGQQLRLCRSDEAVVKFLQCAGDALVTDLPAAAEQACIGCVAGERVFERIDVVTAAYQQARLDQLRQGAVEGGCAHVEDRRQQT